MAERALGMAMLLLLAPVLALVAVVVLADLGAPVLFRQVRVGRGFRPFTLLKFRTMTEGPSPRISRAGRVLRRTKLDELPQLWNIVAGDMSIVGPRPEVAEVVACFCDEYRILLTVRPGLTDPASLAYWDEASLLARSGDPQGYYLGTVMPDKLRLSTERLVRPSLRADLYLILRTAWRQLREMFASLRPDAG